MSDENEVLDPQAPNTLGDEATPETTSGPEDSATSDTENPVSGEGEETPSKEHSELPKHVQKQLDKLKRQRYEAKRQAERERQEREYWQQQALKGSENPQPATATVKPTVEQFTTYEEYLEALSDWKVNQRLSSERQQVQEAKQRETQAQRAETYKSRVEKAQDRYEDFDEVAHGDHWSPSPHMVEAIQESESGPDLAYYLGGHPDEAERIAALSVSAQYREIGKLEERLGRPAPKKTTAVPPPIEPAGSKGKAEKQPWEMEPTEFAEWRRKYIAQRR